VAGAVAVLGPTGQLAAVYGLPRPGAFHWGGVDDPDVIGPQGGVAGEHADQPADRGGQIAQPLVVARLWGQVGEQVPEVGGGEAQPAGLAGESQQGLHHCQRHQLCIGDLRG
jgi:hypothetical protein